MDNTPDLIRNICLLGSMGHGKTALCDNLGAREGYMSQDKVGEQLFTLYRKDEQEKKTTLKCNVCHIVTDCVSKKRVVDPKTGKNTFPEGDKEETKKHLLTICDTP